MKRVLWGGQLLGKRAAPSMGPSPKGKMVHLGLAETWNELLPEPSPWLCPCLPNALGSQSPGKWLDAAKVDVGRDGGHSGRRQGGESSSTRRGAKWLTAHWRGEAESAPFSANLHPGLGIVQGLTGWGFKGPFYLVARKAVVFIIHCEHNEGLLQAWRPDISK